MYIVLLLGGHDLPRAMDAIGRAFDLTTLPLEGGGRINGAFLKAGLIDEISVSCIQGSMVLPVFPASSSTSVAGTIGPRKAARCASCRARRLTAEWCGFAIELRQGRKRGTQVRTRH
jgi:riboflavin biosynthesis pyrimidine reductase